jgi:CYTH domain-containing protein
VRRRDHSAFLTIKGPSLDGGLSRYEFEKEITLDEAEHLFQLCEPGIIDKTRYLVPSGRHTFEVDEFHGDNEGLVMAEVELSAPDEPFEKPDFIAMEVTGDRRFYNSYLKQMPFSQWKNDVFTHSV